MISTLLLGAALLGQLPSAFFTSIRGTYEIELVNGLPPHAGSNTATIESDDNEADLSLPFCTESVCDPGYLTFTFDKTTLTPEGTAGTTTISSEMKTYTWYALGPKRFRFVNFQYKTKNETITLEHILVLK